MAKNFLDKDGVSRLIYNFKSLFATLSHKHEISDITDYTVDSALSSTSTNPIQNKVVNEGFSLVANSLTSMQNSIKGKADKEHLSNYETTANAQAKLDESKDYADASFEIVETSYGDTLTWDGDTSNVTESISDTWFKVSNAELSSEVFSNEFTIEMFVPYAEEPIVVNQNNSSIMFVTDASYIVLMDTGEGCILIKREDDSDGTKGVYFIKINDSYISSLTIPNYNFTETSKKLKDEYLPDHTHSDYATTQYVDSTFARKEDVQDVDLSNYETKEDAQSKLDEAKQYTDTVVSGKANTTHSHDDVYYTETEIDSKLSSKSDTTHKHDSDYDARGTATSTVSTHNSSTSAHNDIRDLITGLTTRLNTLADSDDTTLDQMSEIVAYIKANKDLIDSITTSKVNVSDIIDNLTTNVSNKPLSAAQGVAIKGLIDALQTEVNGKVDSLSDLGITVTATELNYMTGVTSNVQYQLDAKVPTSRTINGKALTGNITLSASDVGAYSKSEINDMELITVNDIDTICGTDLLETSEVKF